MRGLLFLFLLISFPVLAGIEGNGGDVVLCKKSTANDFEGYYSLDWIVLYRKSNDLQEVKNWEDSAKRIGKIIETTAPELAEGFNSFVKGVDNHTDLAAPRLWVESNFGLLDIPDERLKQKIPENCIQVHDKKEKYIQAVRREVKEGVVTYFYDGPIVEKLRKERPVQFSFLAIHEWLWDLTKDVDIVRNVNRMLHTVAAEKYSQEQMQIALTRLGMKSSASTSGFVPICDRSKPIREVLEHKFGLPCADITEVHRKSLTKLSIRDVARGILRVGDFSGFPSLKHLEFEDFPLQVIPEGLFTHLPELKSVYFTRSSMTKFDAKIFAKGISLDEIIFSSEELTSIDLRGISVKGLHIFGAKLKSVKDLKFSSVSDLTLYSVPIEAFEGFDESWKYISNISLLMPDLKRFSCDGLKHLSSLRLTGVKGELDITKKQFAGCLDLRTIHIWNTPKVKFEGDAFQDIKYLYRVAIQDSKLKNLPEGLLSNKYISEVWLHGNEFDYSMNKIFGTNTIEDLHMNDNKFTFLPVWFSDINFGLTPGTKMWKKDKKPALSLYGNKLNKETIEWLNYKYSKWMDLGVPRIED